MLENTIAFAIVVDGAASKNVSYSLDDRPDANSSSYLEATASSDNIDSLMHLRKRGTRNGNFRGTNRSKVTFLKGHTVTGYDPASLVRATSHITTEVVTPVGVSRAVAAELIAKSVAYMQTPAFLDEIVLNCQR